VHTCALDEFAHILWSRVFHGQNWNAAFRQWWELQREMEASEESGESENNSQHAGAAGAAGAAGDGDEGREVEHGGEGGGDDDASARTLSTPFHQKLFPHHLLQYLSTVFEASTKNQANLASINAPFYPLMEALWILVPNEFDVFARRVIGRQQGVRRPWKRTLALYPES
jgi:hypothetical protein